MDNYHKTFWIGPTLSATAITVVILAIITEHPLPGTWLSSPAFHDDSKNVTVIFARYSKRPLVCNPRQCMGLCMGIFMGPQALPWVAGKYPFQVRNGELHFWNPYEKLDC